jgi:putative oxidoreductase
MKKKQLIEYGIAVTRIYLALVFLISGLEKINDLSSFAQSIENYRILPIYLVNIVAIIVPWLEVIAGAFLLLGIYIKENSVIILLLLSIFTLGVLSAILRNLDIDCGCQGTSSGQKVGLLKILENISLLVVAILSIKFPRQVLTFYKQQ